MKNIKQLQYADEFVPANQARFDKLVKLLDGLLNADGCVVYEDGTVGSYVIDLLASVYAKPKVSKLIDERRFVEMVATRFRLRLGD